MSRQRGSAPDRPALCDGDPPAGRASEVGTPADLASPEIRSAGRPTPLDQLRRRWQQLYKAPPPRISRDLLARGIEYRQQEITSGGLTSGTCRKLKTLAKALRESGKIAPDAAVRLKPGARLLREWQGRTHTVTVFDDGFEYDGVIYPSLTKVAREITGTHWSGPRFFGFAKAGRSRRSAS